MYKLIVLKNLTTVAKLLFLLNATLISNLSSLIAIENAVSFNTTAEFTDRIFCETVNVFAEDVNQRCYNFNDTKNHK